MNCYFCVCVLMYSKSCVCVSRAGRAGWRSTLGKMPTTASTKSQTASASCSKSCSCPTCRSRRRSQPFPSSRWRCAVQRSLMISSFSYSSENELPAPTAHEEKVTKTRAWENVTKLQSGGFNLLVAICNFATRCH